MSVIERNEPTNGKGPACDCGSTAVIDANRHAWDCTRRLWVERNDARQQLQGAVRALEAVRDYAGRVCDEYETCDHSHAAWQIANRYLTGGQ